jgi:hypothetical protein
MSLVPELPSDVEIVVNQTEYSDGAGGNSGRVLVLRSPTVARSLVFIPVRFILVRRDESRVPSPDFA